MNGPERRFFNVLKVHSLNNSISIFKQMLEFWSLCSYEWPNGHYWPHSVMARSLLSQKVELYLMSSLSVGYFDQDCAVNSLFLNTLISIRITSISLNFH